MKTQGEARLERLLIFTRAGKRNREEVFREICNELNLEPIFMKGRRGNGVKTLESQKGIVSAVVFQTNNIGEDLNFISEIKLNLRKIPIIFYSTRYSEDIEALIRRIGVHYFLTPSFDKEELALVLEALMERIGNSALQTID